MWYNVGVTYIVGCVAALSHIAVCFAECVEVGIYDNQEEQDFYVVALAVRI